MADRTPLDDVEFAAALAALRPRAASLDRDELFYRAGRASGASPSGQRQWRRRMTTAAGWIAAAVFCGLWFSRPTVTVVETQPAPIPAGMKMVAQSVVPEMPAVDQNKQPDDARPTQSGPPLARPVPPFGFDDFERNRVSLVGTFLNSDHDQPIASATNNERPPERATYAELMRQYLPRFSEIRPGTLFGCESIDRGDRT